jgi:hypothetical protein
MRRREFITLVGGAVAAWPLTAFGKVQRIAFVVPASPGAARGAGQVSGKELREFAEASGEPFSLAFFKELDRLGYVEGQNLLIDGYSGGGRAPHYPDLARDVVSRKPDVIITISTDLTLDFKAATTTIPIVGGFAIPVEAGIVASLARPGEISPGFPQMSGRSSGTSEFKYCNRWCRRPPNSESSNRERRERNMGPKRVCSGWELPGLAHRSIIR